MRPSQPSTKLLVMLERGRGKLKLRQTISFFPCHPKCALACHFHSYAFSTQKDFDEIKSRGSLSSSSFFCGESVVREFVVSNQSKLTLFLDLLRCSIVRSSTSISSSVNRRPRHSMKSQLLNVWVNYWVKISKKQQANASSVHYYK